MQQLTDELVAGGATEFFTFFLTIILASILIWIVARNAKIPNANYGKSLLAAFISTALIFAMRLIMINVIMGGGNEFYSYIVGYLVGMLLSLFIIRALFKTKFAQASLLLLVYFVSNMIALFIISVIFLGGIGAYFDQI